MNLKTQFSKFIIAFFFLSINLLNYTTAQTNGYNATELTNDNGQSFIDVTDIIKDNNGLVWFLSQKNLYKYDGYNFEKKTYNSKYSRIFYDKINNKKYLINYDRIYQFNNNKIDTLLLVNDCYIIKITNNNKNELFILSHNKLVSINIQTKEQTGIWYQTKEDFKSSNNLDSLHKEETSLQINKKILPKKIYDIKSNKNGEIFAIGDSCIFKFNKKINNFIKIHNCLHSMRWRARIIKITNSNIFYKIYRGREIYKYNIETKKNSLIQSETYSKNKKYCNSVYPLLIKDNIIINHLSDNLCINNSNKKYFLLENYSCNSAIDVNNIFLVGTNKGLFKIRKNNYIKFHKKRHYLFNNGTLYASKNGILYQYNLKTGINDSLIIYNTADDNKFNVYIYDLIQILKTNNNKLFYSFGKNLFIKSGKNKSILIKNFIPKYLDSDAPKFKTEEIYFTMLVDGYTRSMKHSKQNFPIYVTGLYYKSDTLYYSSLSNFYMYSFKKKKIIKKFKHNLFNLNLNDEFFINLCNINLKIINKTLWFASRNKVGIADIKNNVFNTVFSANNINLSSSVMLDSLIYLRGRDTLFCVNKYNHGINKYPLGILETGKAIKKPLYKIKNILWFASNKGLFSFNLKDKKIKNYTVRDGILNNDIIASKKDKYNNIWLLSKNGVSKFNTKTKTSINYFYPIHFNNFNFIDLRLYNDSLYMLSKTGITIINAKSDTNFIFPVIITHLKINNRDTLKDLAHLNKIKLNHDKNNISIEFSALDYDFPKNNIYKYILKNFDTDWINTDYKNRIAKYTNLPAGTYNFKVKARNGYGVWNNNGIDLEIIILPPWWQTWWFRTIGISLILFLLYFIYKWRVSSLMKQQKNLEQKVKQRTTEIEQQKEEISAQRDDIENKNEELNQLVEEITTQKEEIETQRDFVQKQKNKIEEIHKEVSQSINYAQRIQNSILPDISTLKQNFDDYFVLLNPKDVVSGDFYWWTNIEDHTVITAVDCTGHGVPGAFMSMLGASFLREIVEKEYITHTGVILRKLRKEIIKALKQKGESGEQKDGMDMSIISINNKTNVMQFSGANNPLYIIKPVVAKKNDEAISNNNEQIASFPAVIRNDGYELHEIKGDKMPIAIYQKMDKFITHEIQLQKGDLLYLFSDGYADQFGGKNGKKLKYKPFKQLLLENADKPMKMQKEILNNTFETWKGNLEQIDDVVVLGLKI